MKFTHETRLVIDSLHCYPLKSGGGINMTRMELTPTGPKYDRMLALVDLEGNFLSQRKFPKMSQIETYFMNSPRAGALIGFWYQGKEHKVPIPEEAELLASAPYLHGSIKIHEDTCPGIDMGDEHADWFSSVLGQKCRLIRQVASLPRIREASSVGGKIEVSFADGYPLQVLSQASMVCLNQRLAEKGAQIAGRDRFRSNIFLKGCPAFHEDSLGRVQIGTAVIRFVKRCPRCMVVNVNQNTGTRDSDSVVLKTLAEFRNEGGKVLFGMNCLIEQPGIISLGDLVTPIV